MSSFFTYKAIDDQTSLRQLIIEVPLALVYRNIAIRYSRSLLGMFWAILQPIILMVTFSLLNGVLKISSEGVPYILFSYAGLLPWTFFSNAVSICGPSIVSNAAIIKKIALPREIFPLAAVLTAFFDFLMSGLVMMGLMVFYKMPVDWSILWLPILCILTGLLAFGVGMILASLGAFKQDFIIAISFLIQIWLFVTPVIYSLNSVPEQWRSLYFLNPMVGIVEGFRAILLHSETPPLIPLLWSGLMTVLILVPAWLLFRWLSRYFADVI